MSEKTVFISYRRDTAGKAFARSVHEALKQQGYDAFLDVDDIAAGYWAEQILTEVPKRAHFLLLVTPGAMDRCAKQDDWVRREFELAKANQRNIVPVFEESVDIAKLRQECPRSMKGIFEFQGLTLRHESFPHGIETLVNRYIPAHKAPKADVQPVYIKPPEDNKPPIVLVTLLLLFIVAIVAGVALILRPVKVDPHLTDETPMSNIKLKSAETKTLVLDNVKEDKTRNEYVINILSPKKDRLFHLKNNGAEPEGYRIIDFPDDEFYSNLMDDNHLINAGESKSFRVILLSLFPKSNDYVFVIRNDKHNENIRVSIHLEGDWKAFHQQQLAEFTEKTKALTSKEQIYQAAVQLIDRESEGLAQGPKQALTGKFLVNAGQNDAAVLAFAEAAKTAPKMVDIPAGSFIMGADKTDESANKDEMPRRQVNLAGFKLSQYEITQGQWKAVMPTNPSDFKQCGDDCPVENVSWDEVKTFIRKLNALTGGNYRLPSEAEWEYACRAGEYTQFCGSDDAEAVAWYDGNSKDKTHAVGGKKPNAFGLYDMSGNVWEWVQDCYHDNYSGAPTDGSVWDEGANCAGRGRVVRGGSWDNNPNWLRSAFRSYGYASSRYGLQGFRLVQD